VCVWGGVFNYDTVDAEYPESFTGAALSSCEGAAGQQVFTSCILRLRGSFIVVDLAPPLDKSGSVSERQVSL